MKKTTFYLLFAMLTLLSIDLYSQCIPTGVRPVFGTVTGSTGTQTFTNIPTGNVIQFTAPAVGVFYTISLCATNPANTPDGTNDSYLTMLSANSAAATSLGFADDGCTTNIPNGWGPTTMTWTSTAVGNTFLYLTE